MRGVLFALLFVIACTDVAGAHGDATQYMRSLGLRPSVVRCVRSCGEDAARCTVVTRAEQVYTLVCRFGDCWVERGPGQ